MFLRIILFFSVDYLLCSKISKLFLQKEIEIQPYIPACSFLVFLFSGFPKSFKISSAVTLLMSSYRSMFSKSFDHSTLNTSCPRCSKAFPMLLVPANNSNTPLPYFLNTFSASHSGSGAHLTPWDYSFPPSFSSVYRLFSCFCKRHNFCRPLLPDCAVSKIKMA